VRQRRVKGGFVGFTVLSTHQVSGPQSPGGKGGKIVTGKTQGEQEILVRRQPPHTFKEVSLTWGY